MELSWPLRAYKGLLKRMFEVAEGGHEWLEEYYGMWPLERQSVKEGKCAMEKLEGKCLKYYEGYARILLDFISQCD